MTSLLLPPLAYLDPGTGSLILQVVAACLISSAVLLRKYLFAPIAWLTRRRKARSDASDGLHE